MSEQSTAITVREPDKIMELAKVMAKSGHFGAMAKQNPAVIGAKMLLGASIGINPITAVNLIHLIPLKSGAQLAISPKAQKARVLASEVLWEWNSEELTKGGKHFGHKIHATRYRGEGRPKLEATVTYTLDDAKAQGLDSKDNWKSVPKRMTLWRATGYLIDELFSDISYNVQSAALFDVDLSEDGTVIEGSYEVVDEIEAKNVSDVAVEFGKLMEEYGADRVLAVGSMPPTNAKELQELKEKLKNG